MLTRVLTLAMVAVCGGCVGEIGTTGSDAGSSELEPDPPASPIVRRLTVDEYVNTVQATVGVDIRSEAEAVLPPDLRSDGFSNTSSSLIVSLAHIEGYHELAHVIVSQLADPGEFLSGFTSCTEPTTACQTELIERLGLLMFRRPPTGQEVDLLLAVFEESNAVGDDFEVGAALVLETMLQSPRFIYRIEPEGDESEPAQLDGYDVAARLSYTVWGGPPDEKLYAAAAADRLWTEEQVVTQLDRMLANPRARSHSLRFVSDWLHLERLDFLSRDPELYPDWDPALASDMKAETLAFFEYLVWDQQRPLTELFNGQVTFVTPELAAHYDLPNPSAGEPLALTEIPERGGLLTQGALLTVGGDGASLVGRGLFILETLLCGGIDSPPSGVDTTPPEVMPGLSERSYSEDRVDNPSCGGCHFQMEPQAWGIDRFDGVGAYRLEDQFGNDLYEDGWLWFPGDNDPSYYDTTAEMMDLLAAGDQVRMCLAQKMAQFSIGRPLEDHDARSLDVMRADLAGTSGTYGDLMRAIVRNPIFR